MNLRMSYIILGHASEEGEQKPVPKGCMLILSEECGVQGTFPHYLYSILSDPSIKPLLDDPVKNKGTLETLFKKPLTIYVEGEPCPPIQYTLLNHSVNKETNRANVFNIEPSGVYTLPNDEHNWTYHEDKKGIGRYTHKMTGKMKEADFKRIYRGAVFPTIDSLVPSSVGSFLGTVRYSQSELFAKFPGIHYNFLCRSLPAVDKTISSVLSAGFPGVDLFTEDSYNRPMIVSNWIDTLKDSRLNDKQRESLANLKAILAGVFSRRSSSEGALISSKRPLERLIRLIQISSVEIDSDTSDDEVPTLGFAEAAATLAGEIIAGASIEFLNSVDTHNGYTPLACASASGNLPIVSQLLLRGVDVNLADYDGVTPLMLALSGPYPLVAGALLEGGSLPSAVDNEGDSALHIAAGDESLLEIMGALLGRGADPNLGNGAGETPLHIAASNDFLGGLTLLVEKGGDPNIQDKEGRTPLIEAIIEQNVECAAYLVPMTNLLLESRGRTALGYAKKEGLESVVALISANRGGVKGGRRTLKRKGTEPPRRLRPL